MERRTDAWADLTAGSGGAAHTVALRLGRKHPRSAESHQSPVRPPSPLNGGGTDRLFGSPEERHRRGNRGAEGIRFPERNRRRETFVRLSRSVRSAARPRHIWRGRRQEEAQKHSVWQLTPAVPFPLQESCIFLCPPPRRVPRIA